MTSFAAFDAYVRAHEREYVEELKSLVRLPTVSAQKSAIDETARAVLERTLRDGGAARDLRVDVDRHLSARPGRGADDDVDDHTTAQPPIRSIMEHAAVRDGGARTVICSRPGSRTTKPI